MTREDADRWLDQIATDARTTGKAFQAAFLMARMLVAGEVPTLSNIARSMNGERRTIQRGFAALEHCGHLRVVRPRSFVAELHPVIKAPTAPALEPAE